MDPHDGFRPLEACNEPLDLVILGLGNSLFGPSFSSELRHLLERARAAIRLFGTRYREDIPLAHFRAILDPLQVWYTHRQRDAEVFGRGRSNVAILGDWLITAFPMSHWTLDQTMVVDQAIWSNLPLDRVIQSIQASRRVLSTRLHPLLCALTSSQEVAYREQREQDGDRISGKFGDLLTDIFGRSFPEDRFFPVDREPVVAYKYKAHRAKDELRQKIASLLGEVS